MTVRPARDEDVPAIQRVAYETWHDAYADILDRDTVERALAEWYADETVRDGVESESMPYLVATLHGRVIGYAAATPDESAGVAHLSAVYVDREYWGEGVGTRLLGRLYEALAGMEVNRIRLDVLAANDLARSFYEARGFACETEREAELFGESVREAVYVRDLP